MGSDRGVEGHSALKGEESATRHSLDEPGGPSAERNRPGMEDTHCPTHPCETPTLQSPQRRQVGGRGESWGEISRGPSLSVGRKCSAGRRTDGRTGATAAEQRDRAQCP